MKTTHDDDEYDSRQLRCHFDCDGKTSHRFRKFDGIPASAFDNPDMSLSELTGDDPTVGQPIWECKQCGGPRHGPDPTDSSENSPSESASDFRPDRNLTNRDKYKSSIFNRPQNHLEAITVKKLLDEFRQQGSYDESEVIKKVKSEADFPVTTEKIEQAIHNLTFNDQSDEPGEPPTPLETEVLAVLREFDDGNGVETAALIAKVKDRWDISTGDVETAIEGVLHRGECYKPDEKTIIST
jgi:hypothetical protein